MTEAVSIDGQSVEAYKSPLQQELAHVSAGMRRRERKSYIFLAMLVVVAGAAVAAGVVADSEVFWGVAGTVFLMATAGIVAYAASGLGIFAEMVELLSRNPPPAD